MEPNSGVPFNIISEWMIQSREGLKINMLARKSPAELNLHFEW